MESIQKYLEQDLFIEITLHYKRETYYRWGEQDRTEKYFTYKIKDLANTNMNLVSESTNHIEYYLDTWINSNTYENYDLALKAAVKQCDEYLETIESSFPKSTNNL